MPTVTGPSPTATPWGSACSACRWRSGCSSWSSPSAQCSPTRRWGACSTVADSESAVARLQGRRSVPDLPAYTVAAVAAPVAVVALELLVLRTGLLRRLQYWASMVVLLGFQVLFGGWLTKPHAPVVHYADEPTI